MSETKRNYKVSVPKSQHLTKAYVPFSVGHGNGYVSFDENGTAVIVATEEQARWFENHGYIISPID